MKTKLQIIIAFLLILTSFTAKSQTIISGYNDNDVSKLQAFFAQTDGTTTNGVKINSAYSSTDPTTWIGIIWNSSSTKRVTKILISRNNLVGSLNCSGLDSLIQLNCPTNKITSLNISTNKALAILFCYGNKLTTLDVSANTALRTLDCDGNELTALDLSKNIALTELYCSINTLKTLDVSKNKALTKLFCNNNQLTALDISKNIALTELYCRNNQLTALDISKNKALAMFYCDNNVLKFSDLQHDSTITYLLDFPQHPFIPIGVDTTNNTMSAIGGDTIDLSSEANVGPTGSKALTTFNVWKKDNKNIISEITNLCVIDSGKIILPKIYTGNYSVFITMSNPNFPDFITQTTPVIPDYKTMQTVTFKLLNSTSVIIPGYNDNDVKKLQTFFAKSNGQITNGRQNNLMYRATNPNTWTGVTWDNSSPKRVTTIYFGSENLVDSFDCSGFAALTILNCQGNKLAALDVSKNIALTKLYCSHNKLTALCLSGDTALSYLDCDYNQLSTLDISTNIALTELMCPRNHIKDLDVSNNKALDGLLCSKNQLTALDVSKNKALIGLYCEDNQLNSLNLGTNKTFTNLHCYNNKLKFSDLQHDSIIKDLQNLPQRPFIPVGLDTTNNSMSAIVGDTIDLSSEANVGATGSKALTTFNVWKKDSNGIISEITNLCVINSGKIILPNTNSNNDSVFITMSNPNFTNFTTQTTPIIPHDSTMRSVIFRLLDSSYNYNDMKKLRAFFAQTDGSKTNGLKINSAYDPADPTTWFGVTWNNSSPKRVTLINFSKSLVGGLNVSNFDSLTDLSCVQNYLTSIDVSGCNNIKYIECNDNNLTSLNIPNLTKLKILQCYNNKLINLNIPKNTALTYLDCSDNELTSLNTQNLTKLTTLSCSGNELTSLNTQNLTKLVNLSCFGNELTSLNLQNLTNLGQLNCSNGKLTSLNIQNLTNLGGLICSNNKLKFSDMQNNSLQINITDDAPQQPFIPIGLDTANNSMSVIGGDTIDLSSEVNVGPTGSKALTTFNVWKKANDGTISEITNICVIDSGKIILPNIHSNNDSIFITMSNPNFPHFRTQTTPVNPNTRTMRTVIFRLLDSLSVIIPSYNDNDVKKLQTFFSQTDGTTTNGVKVNTAYDSADPTTWTGVTWDNSSPKRVTKINICYTNLVGTFDCSDFTALTGLYCPENQLTALDFSGDTALNSLDCSWNKLSTLDVDGFNNLSILRCNGNQLTSLNVKNLTKLQALFCYNNQLKFSDLQHDSIIWHIKYSPQRPFIPIGVDTANNSMSAIGGDTINLSSEANVGPAGSKALTTFNVWKKANDGTISEITNTCVIDSGKIVLPNTYSENDSVFITMSNTNFRYFTTQTTPVIPDSSTMRTVTFKWLSSSSVSPTENNNKTTIKIYPNPANNEISITGNEEDLNSIKIYNTLGQDVTKYTNYSTSGIKQIKIDISKLTTGIYILTTKNTTNKLIVK